MVEKSARSMNIELYKEMMEKQNYLILLASQDVFVISFSKHKRKRTIFKCSSILLVGNLRRGQSKNP